MQKSIFSSLTAVFLLSLSCSCSLAEQNGLAIGFKTYAVFFPALNLTVPMDKDNSVDIGYLEFSFFNSPTYYWSFAYRIKTEANEFGKTTTNIGFINRYSTGGVVQFLAWSSTGYQPPSNNIYPLIAIERESIFFENKYFSVRIGYPEIVGFGLKLYG